jgi:hypothetical protein
VKIAASEVIVDPHDVPEDRAAPNGHHRLRFELGFLAQARALSAAEDYNPKVTALPGTLHRSSYAGHTLTSKAVLYN